MRCLAAAITAVAVGTAPLAAQQSPHADSAITAAEAAATHWFALLADANYGAAWEQASRYFRDHVSREQWRVNAEQLDRQFRRTGQRKLVEARWLEDRPPLPRAEYVVLRWVTDLPEQREVGERMIVTHEADGGWRPATYDLYPDVDGVPIVVHDLHDRRVPVKAPDSLRPHTIVPPGGP
jgi:hypothetical protein